MSDGLLTAQSHLLDRCRQLKANPNWLFADTPPSAASQSWTWQSQDLEDVKNPESAAGALIADPELGICLYLISFRHQPKVRDTVARALAVRQGLLPLIRKPDIPVDELGEWRVALNWLVDEIDLPSWIEQVADIRERTGHFEEISADVVVRLSTDADWDAACQRHGFPRLLFTTRDVFGKREINEVDRWQSADAAVTEELQKLPSDFPDVLAQQCAAATIKHALAADEGASAPTADIKPAADVLELRVQNFRNIDDLNVLFRNPPEQVSATIIQGPNGSGKSSIFESLSFALCGTSMRHRQYAEDPNRLMWGKEDRYFDDYIVRRRNDGETKRPIVALNGTAREITKESVAACASQGDSLAANLFSQECSRSLVAMRAAELGAQIAGAFSPVAERAIEFVENALRASQDEQRTFNNEWGLRANVTRRQTVIDQVLLRMLRPYFGQVDGLIAWLQGCVGTGTLVSQTQAYVSQLSAWRDDSSKLARAGNLEGLAEYFARGQALFEQVRSFINDIANSVQAWPDDIESAWNLMVTWQRARSKAPTSSSQLKNVERQLKDSQEQLRLCLERGNLLRAHKQSLDAVAALMPAWDSIHPDECPTCGTDVSDRGNIRKLVSDRMSEVEHELSITRREYTRIKAELDGASKQVAELGGSVAPISPEVQVGMQAALDLIGAPRFGTETDQDSSIGSLLSHLKRVPRFDLEISDPAFLAAQITDQVEHVNAEYDRVASLPVAWRRVRDELQNRLAGVTARHLPSTVQAIWNEFAQNMLPAPWQYPGRLALKVKTGSAGAEVAVVIKNGPSEEALAAHLLNGAEVHNIGLAWFFSEYVLRGRFRYRAVVLDDPAHAMDQPTYREFCRLLETLLRLHRVQRVPLSLILLLHQDTRAIDAARATGGTLHFLRWNYHTPVSLRRIKLQDDSFAAPQPLERLRAVRTAQSKS